LSRDREAEYRAGKAIRERVPRSVHARFEPPESRPDPLAILAASDEGRLPNLLPIRYARMAQNPFGFFRGAASIMANDLAATPTSGLRTQIGGDAHLANFGAFATPERRKVFDINDFDETVRGPWEFDLKRLTASVVVAGRQLGFRKGTVASVALACARTYRERMLEFATMHVLEVWYARLDESELARALASGERRPTRDSASAAFPDLALGDDGAVLGIADKPPLLFHPPDAADFRAHALATLHAYRHTLVPERRDLFDRFDFVDAAYKVVGVGSVGTRCAIALLVAADGDRLILQLKEARSSVHEPFVGKSGFADDGERVVVGQRAMQTASDLFLGWARGADGRTYYVRQLRDAKVQADIEDMTASEFERYAALCAHALARGHAKAGGNAASIAGYLGRGTAFDEALVAFATAYADCNERDYASLLAAVRAGRIEVASAA
jgi:uncharacterized protein (DUF2252 family)